MSDTDDDDSVQVELVANGPAMSDTDDDDSVQVERVANGQTDSEMLKLKEVSENRWAYKMCYDFKRISYQACK